MRIVYSALILTVFAVGCGGGDNPSPRPSTLQGAVALTSFASPPISIDAVDEAGARTHWNVDAASGAFSVRLTKGHVYHLSLVRVDGDEPLVFPRNGNQIDAAFRVSSGGASVAIGAVRHFDSAPVGGFSLAAGGADNADPNGTDGECVDGRLQGSGAPCVDDQASVSCDNGVSNGDNQTDGECQNGVDQTTGKACTDTASDIIAADGTKPFAVPDQPPPSNIGGCEDGSNDGETND